MQWNQSNVSAGAGHDAAPSIADYIFTMISEYLYTARLYDQKKTTGKN